MPSSSSRPQAKLERRDNYPGTGGARVCVRILYKLSSLESVVQGRSPIVQPEASP
jgi:hypothetical protein